MFDTRNVTVSPCFQRSVGAGSEWFTVTALREAPVKFTVVSSILSSKLLPESVDVGSRDEFF
jgi:hypothetical protein